MYIVTTQQMQAAEKAADASGLSYSRMMENAGQAVAQAIKTNYEIVGARVLVLVGPGNNGGDGLVIARYLAQWGAAVTVYVWKRNTEGDENWALLGNTGIECIFGDNETSPQRLTQLLNESAIIVDALLGTGVSRPITGTLADLLDQTKAVVTARRAPQATLLTQPALPYSDTENDPVIVAVDVPTGLNSDTGAVDPHTFTANLTVTLAAVKRGHVMLSGPNVVGQLVVGDIGITANNYPNNALPEMATAPKITRMLPPRLATSHKGTFGTALLVVGSINYVGAAVLAGQSAVRSGAGLVTLASPKAIHPILASRLIEATHLPLPDNQGLIAPGAVEIIQQKFNRATAMLVGSGMGFADSTATFLTNLLAETEKLPSLVLDADALNILAQQDEWWGLLPPDSILTPHPGEMARLMNTTIEAVETNRLETAAKMAIKWGQIVVLKGAHTVVAAPNGRVMVLPFANPALAKAGSGDVLAGAIVSLRTQGLAPFEAAVAGAYIHGLAGELAREQLGATSVIAGDLISFLPVAIRELAGE